ncbi:hypothetical protein [Pseudomarimonas salicorniae]|uniref:Uncharacterized protein n=1 Tax=Pseudomarimonas salicorniae TaxID=2933270 RepID=A0ABT0GHV1_9GAMM|nr:hypothetical protein [Lysobacter sp. CAU 1642]MCK7594131.1 hypothetical protein [Lysobacter sp. CAU 1642]
MRTLPTVLRGLAGLAACLTILGVPSPARADCERLLVSGYHSTVHVYDGCTGGFLRELDARTRLNGAQAVRERDGLLYVVAEGSNTIVRYRADSFEFVDFFVSVTGNPGITGVTFGPDGDMYLGGYNSDSVFRFDGQTGAAKGEVVRRADGANGVDNGLVFGPDGLLYVPGFDSHNVIRWNPATGRSETFIASGSGGLLRTRGILFEPDGSGVLVSSEGSGEILRYHRDGRFDRRLAQFEFGPNGMAYAADGNLLVTGFGGDRVERVDPRTGQRLGTLVPAGSGGLSGATFLTILPPTAAPEPVLDTAQIGSQYWVTGAGLPEGKRLELELFSSTGTGFGDRFNAAELAEKRWGRLRIDFTGCDSGEFSWASSAADSAGFGDGGYPLERIAPNPASERCQAEGFASVSGHEWMAGTWFGGPARSGEGLFIDVLADGVVLAAWFTHRPAAEAK